jgi:hypothetical protein
VHWKHGGAEPGAQGERSQTPSGPSGSWHCTPGSTQVAGGGDESEPESQAIAAKKIEIASAAMRRTGRGFRISWERNVDQPVKTESRRTKQRLLPKGSAA